MNKKILMSAVTILATASIVGGMTIAYFSDSVSSTGNTFTVGILDLSMDGGQTAGFGFSNIKPADTGTHTWVVKNSSANIDGTVSVIHPVVTDTENGCAGIELLYDSDCADTTQAGELSPAINVVLCVDGSGNGICGESDDTQLYTGTLKGLTTGTISTFGLSRDSSKKVTLTWIVPETGDSDNAWQGDSASIDLTFQLDQTH